MYFKTKTIMINEDYIKAIVLLNKYTEEHPELTGMSREAFNLLTDYAVEYHNRQLKENDLGTLVDKLEKLLCIKYPARVGFKKTKKSVVNLLREGLIDDWLGKEEELKERIKKLEKELNIV